MLETVVAIMSAGGCLLIWSVWAEPQKLFVKQRRNLESRSQVINSRWIDLSTQAGFGHLPLTLVIIPLFFAVGIGGIIMYQLTGLWVIGLLSACAIAFGPWLWLRARATKFRATMREVWPAMVDNLVSAVKAGMGLGEGLVSSAAHAPEEISAEMHLFVNDYRASGSLQHSLDNFKDRLADPVVDRIVEAIKIADQFGGMHLVALLENLAQMLREEQRTRAEILARQSWIILSARLAAIAPWVLLVLLSTRPEVSAAYATAMGTTILIIGAFASVGAYFAMMRLGRIKEYERVLR